jgi:hypothetical protein
MHGGHVMKRALLCLSLLFMVGAAVRSQDVRQPGSEPKVPLTEQAIAYDAAGRTVLSARLRTTNVTGAIDSPVTDVRLVVTNSGPLFYNYVSGWATFYDADGIRCGEGLFNTSAFAPGESVDLGTPGIRVTCAASTWRITATNLLTQTTETAKPATPPAAAPGTVAPTVLVPSPAPTSNVVDSSMILNINGEDHPIQVGKPIVLRNVTGEVRIVLKRR